MNPYLNKALGGARKSVDGIATAWKDASPATKLSLGVSATGLGISAANFANGRRMTNLADNRNKIESQSLNALKKIHETLENNTNV